MNGRLYGVGVGPGDPELLTLKAVKIMKECDIIAIPSKEKETCAAYQIAKQAIPELEHREILAFPMPMTKDSTILQKNYDNIAKQLASYLALGKQIAFLTLGDPTIYSTYLYVHQRVKHMGYPTKIINGIPSFCAAAALCNYSLVERNEPLHILPGSYPVEEYLSLPGTKILMKSGKKMKEVKEQLLKTDLTVVMVENCGMEQEMVYSSVSEIPDSSSYYSLIIAKQVK